MGRTLRQPGDRRGGASDRGAEAKRPIEDDLLGIGVAVHERGGGVADRQRGAANRLAQVAGADQVAVFGRQRLHQGAMSRSRVLELVDHHEWEALRQRTADICPLAEQALQLDHQVAGVKAPAIAQDAIVTRVQVRELPLALGSLALGRALRLALALFGPVAQPAGGDPFRLQGVDAAQEPGEQPSRVTADLVPAQRQLVEPVQQHRQPVGGADGGEEGVEPRLESVLSKQPLGEDFIGRDPELLVGKLDQGGRPRPQAGSLRRGNGSAP